MNLQNFKVVLFAILLGLIGLSIVLGIYSASQKWQASSLQIAIVDMEKVRENLPVIQMLNNELKKTLQDYYTELSVTEKKLKLEHQELLKAQEQKISPELSKNLEARKKQFEKMFMEAQKNVEDKQKSINLHHHQAMEKVQNIINESIKIVANSYNTSLVLSKNNILYGEKYLDLTDAVLKNAVKETQHIHMG